MRAAGPLGDDRHQPLPHTSSSTLRSDEVKRHGVSQTTQLRRSVRPSPPGHLFPARISNRMAAVVDDWLGRTTPCPSSSKRERAHERHLCTTSWVRALHGPRPQPRDHRRLAPVRQLRLRVQVADALRSLVAHPVAVVANVLGKALRALPGRAVAELRPRLRVDGGCPANFGGISISAFVISTATGFRSLACASSPSRCASSGIEPPPQNGSSTGGGLPSVAFMISARACLQHGLVVRVLPLDQLLDDPEEPLPLRS